MSGDPKGAELTLKSEKEKFDELWKTTEWHNKDSVVKLFPVYVQEQHVFKKVNKKVASGKVEIDNFTMKTPFGDKELLKNTSLVIEPHTRQCLYGQNSTGKTLLFTNMSEGKIKDFPKHIHIHHCKELENHELSESVLDTVVNSHPFINVLKIVKPKVEEVLAAAKTEGSGVAPEQVAQLQDVLDWVKFYMNGLRIDESVEKASKMLRVLGFDDVGQKKPCSALSGGLRMRVALCMAFFIEADLLLLDEPTNHLDFPSVLWLENRLRGYKSSFLLVSHDRELLNNVVNSVVLIEDLQLKYYTCSFKDFEKKKATEDKKKFDEIEKFLAKNLNADPSTMAGKLRAEKKAWSEKYYQAQIAMAGKFTFPKATPLAKQLDENGQPKKPEDISLIHLKNVRFSWAPEVENPVFIFNDPISFNVTASTRVGCLGPNGAGKSTFLKLLTGKIVPSNKPGDKHMPDIGEVVTNPNFILAYFGQHSTAELDLELTAIEFMGREFPNEQAGHLRNHLAKTGVVGPVQDTRMQRLSFSQRSCVIFSKLTFVCPHLLIMDEPTNFLDLESVDSLIAACNKYAGALLLVSHNRDFLRKCAKQYLSIVPGHFELYNDLKTAERATYTFIAEMEEGGSVGKGMDLSKGGGSVHASQVAGGVATAAKSNNGVISMSAPMPSAAEAQKIAAAKAAVKYAVGDKVQALWTDGKWYAGLVKKVVDPVKGVYAVTYTAYGNTANLPAASIKKEEPKAAAAAAPKKK